MTLDAAVHATGEPARWADRIGRGLLALCGLATLGAFANGIGIMAAVAPERLISEAWRTFAYLVFAGLFAMLVVAPRRQRGTWELVFLHKIAITVFAFAAGNTPDAQATWPIDLVLVLVTASAYVLCRGWHGWRATGVSDREVVRLGEAWRDLWNNDLTQTGKIVAPGFVSHAAPLMGGPAGDSTGSDLLNTWVAGIHQLLTGLNFTIQLGPFRDEDIVVLRWRAEGTYTGALPGTESKSGRTVVFYGTDTLRVENGLIVEYWANADSLWFAQQIGLVEKPALDH